MKKRLPKFLHGLLTVALYLTVTVSWGQERETIFSENMGTPGGTATIAANNFQNITNPPVITFTGTADVRNTTPSSTYTGASGGGNVFFTTSARTFIISNLNTSAFSNIILSFGQYKPNNTANNELVAEYSTDGTNFTNIAYTRTTGNGTTNWTLVTATGTVPSSANLILRFRNTSTTQFRLDDVKLTGIASAAAPSITTTQVTAANITTTSAVAGGNVTSAGTASVTARGLVWSTVAGPAIEDTNDFTIPDAGTTGAFTSTLENLSSNTRYFYRAYATNSIGTNYGTEYSFYTNAIVPGAPVVDAANSTVNSLTVAITPNGNNENVTYAIRVNGTNYVQADGTLGTTLHFETAANWGTKLVIGLVADTSYTFDVAAKTSTSPEITGYNTNTEFGPTAVGNTLPSTSPTLTSSTTLFDFGNVCTNVSITNNFTFSATNLTDNSVLLVSALSGYTYSLTEAGTYSPTLTINGLPNNTPITVWVRFTPTAVQAYDGAIHVDGQDANSSAQLTIAVTGAGINTAGTVVTNIAATNVTTVSATLAGTVTAGCTPFSTYGFEYSTSPAFTAPTQVTSTNLSGVSYTATLANLSPETTYYFRAFGTDDAGTHYGAQGSFTTASLSAPVATAGTNITQNSFTANWNTVTGADNYRLDVSTSPSFGTGNIATELFISEYFEGEINNELGFTNSDRAIEIYNGTGADVDLSQYTLRSAINGGQNFSGDLILAGILGNGETFVVTSTSAGAPLRATADLVVSFSTANTAVFFTGNDAVGLFKGDTVVDVVGVSQSSNWEGGADTTLRRKSNVYVPTVTYDASQWDSYPVNTISGLGNHDYDFAPSFLEDYNDAPISGTSAIITGLTPYTNYYYRVRAHSTNSTSNNSNRITVTTKPAVVTWTGSPAAWVPAVAIDNTIDVVIDADYATGVNGAFTAKSVTLNAEKTFTVTTGTTLTIEDSIVNNATVENFVVQNNAALLQNGISANTSAITVIKNSNPLYRLDYTLWASPVSGQTVGNFSPETLANRFYDYRYAYSATANNGAGGDAEQYFAIDASTTFATAKGYLIRMPNGNFGIAGYNEGTATYSFAGTFKGAPHNGFLTTTASTQGDRYTAIGNPYPSPISVVDFFTANSTVINGTSGLYFWRKKNNSEVSSYATLTLAAYTANSGYEANPVEGGDADGASGFFNGPETEWTIAQGQGFFVQTAVSPSDTNISFNNSMRRPAPLDGEQSFFRTTPSTRSRLWLNLSNNQNSFSQTAIAYMDNATNGLDYGYDGTLLNDGGSVALYSLAANTNLAVQARPAFTTNDVVPMGFTATAAGQYNISIDHTDGLFNQGQDVFIKDNVLNTVTSLENPYTFTTEPGTFNQRFEIVYTNEALGTDKPVLTANNVIVFKEGTSININTGNAQMTSVTVYDINGRTLYTKTADGVTTSIDNLQVSQQVLIIEINTVNGKVSKRIVY
jgi:hypothetical protein